MPAKSAIIAGNASVPVVLGEVPVVLEEVPVILGEVPVILLEVPVVLVEGADRLVATAVLRHCSLPSSRPRWDEIKMQIANCISKMSLIS